MKSGNILFAALLFVAGGCFVSTSDCESRGVVVTPCAVSARAGQTVVLRAHIPGAPTEPVDWILPAAVGTAFAVTAEPNRLTLISLQNVPGNYPIQAASQTDSSIYGGGAVGVSSASFSSQAPPFVIFGGDFPVGSKYSATAAGGNLYYVAYAGVGAFLVGETSALGPPPNFFVRQYSLSTNQLLREVGGQFTSFAGTQTATPIIPNVAADCAGNGYWVDFVSGSPPSYVLRRLSASGAGPTEQALGAFTFFGFATLSVACDGAIYYVATDAFGQGNPLLYRIGTFGQAPVAVNVTPMTLPLFTDVMTADTAGRLLIGDSNPDGTPGLQRLVVDPDAMFGPVAAIDPTFSAENPDQSIFDVTTDALGVVYVATSGAVAPVVQAMNQLGGFIYEIGTYEYICATGCTVVTCGEQVPFTDILSLAAAPNGALRIVDDVATDGLPAVCQEGVRYVLIDPQ